MREQYFIASHLFTFLLFAPWLSVTTSYDGVFENQERVVKKPWFVSLVLQQSTDVFRFSLFQVMGSYTGGGLSLADEYVPLSHLYRYVVNYRAQRNGSFPERISHDL